MRILVTGSREWTNRDVIYHVLDHYLTVARFRDEPQLVIVHGACPRGADKIADEWCEERAVPPERYPADWNRYGSAAGQLRNLDMVHLGADVCVAFPLGRSPGTRHCMAAAKTAGIEVHSFESYGVI